MSDNGIGLNGAGYDCTYCHTRIHLEQGDENRGSIFSCEACGKHFCTSCFEEKTDLYVSDLMRYEKCLCPDCMPAKYHPWTAYCAYLREWAFSHRDLGFCNNTPACYDEWLGCEWEQMRQERQDFEPEHVHVLIYHERSIGYVGVDVFDNYDAVFRQFEERLKQTKATHPKDGKWIEAFTAGYADNELYFRDKSGYEVIYRKEILQADAETEV